MTSAKGNGAVPLAEQALMLMLMLSRNAPRWLASQREHRWDRYTHGELAGATCGLIGLGNSGRDLALKAAAMHMRVLGMRRGAPEPVPGVDRVYPGKALHELLAASDFVVVTAPLTDETRGLLGPAELGAMRPTAFLVVVSRGGIVDQAALGSALRAGTIAGAGLDAHADEPLAPDSEVWDWPNAIVTPHNGATTAATRRRGIDIAADNLGRFARGAALHNVVDLAAGY
jgi:phosphoglycerate dehydrogenase-like enzyme